MRRKVAIILLLMLFMQCSTTINMVRNSEGVQIDSKTDAELKVDEEGLNVGNKELDSIKE